ncbi:hypothetical protein [Gordonia sp. (in: high G+C Gram-positive bacteria)]|uniref:hypothetical protein n=1 Tax=Gordonia sp. (in: high G+C Gram-positive bacteria) TaxID=84139 RepID=UPI0039E41CC0
MADGVVLRRGNWTPLVIERDGQLVYDIPIDSGVVSFSREFPIGPDEFRVLRDDVERYYFLFAALHHPYQLAETNLSEAERQRVFRTILFGSRDEVEAYLTAADGAGNGAISNLVGIVTQADYRELRAGRWFGVGADAPREP